MDATKNSHINPDHSEPFVSMKWDRSRVCEALQVAGSVKTGCVNPGGGALIPAVIAD